MGREYEPTVGQWYENLEDNELFRVVSVDEDAALVEIQYEDGDVEEMEYETWQELDLELADEPEGWAGEEDTDEEEDEDDWDEDDEDEDDDWDDDDDEDDAAYDDRSDH